MSINLTKNWIAFKNLVSGFLNNLGSNNASSNNTGSSSNNNGPYSQWTLHNIENKQEV